MDEPIYEQSKTLDRPPRQPPMTTPATTTPAGTHEAMNGAGYYQCWRCPVCGQLVALAGEVLGMLRGPDDALVPALLHRDCLDLVERLGHVEAAWEALDSAPPQEFNKNAAAKALNGLFPPETKPPPERPDGDPAARLVSDLPYPSDSTVPELD